MTLSHMSKNFIVSVIGVVLFPVTIQLLWHEVGLFSFFYLVHAEISTQCADWFSLMWFMSWPWGSLYKCIPLAKLVDLWIVFEINPKQKYLKPTWWKTTLEECLWGVSQEKWLNKLRDALYASLRWNHLIIKGVNLMPCVSWSRPWAAWEKYYVGSMGL